MKLRTYLIASTALFAGSSAFAADLPVVAEPVDYVKVCDAFGAGYFQVPGANTCIKLSGEVSATIGVTKVLESKDGFTYTAKSDAELTLESTTEFELGLLKTYLGGSYAWEIIAAEDNHWSASDAYVVLDMESVDITAGYTDSIVDGPLTGETATQINAMFDLGGGSTIGFGIESANAYGGTDGKLNFVAIAGLETGFSTTTLGAALNSTQGWEGGKDDTNEITADGFDHEYGYAIGLKQEFSFGEKTSFYLTGRYGSSASGYVADDNPFSDYAENEYEIDGNQLSIDEIWKSALGALDSLAFTTMHFKGGAETNLTDKVTFELNGYYTRLSGGLTGTYQAPVHLYDYDLDLGANIYGIDAGLTFAMTDHVTLGVTGEWEQANIEAKVSGSNSDQTAKGGYSAEGTSNTFTLGSTITYAFTDNAEFELEGEYSRTNNTLKFEGENIYKDNSDDVSVMGTFSFIF